MQDLPNNYVKVFTPEECKNIINYAENLNSWDSFINEGKTTSYKLVNLGNLDWVNEKFKQYINDVLGLKITHTKYVRCIKYEKGDLFEKHIDRVKDLDFYNTFAYNVNTILNEDFVGGDFILNDKIYPKKRGYVYYYSSDTWHEVTEVTEGTRYSVLFGVFTDNIKRKQII